MIFKKSKIGIKQTNQGSPSRFMVDLRWDEAASCVKEEKRMSDRLLELLRRDEPTKIDARPLVEQVMTDKESVDDGLNEYSQAIIEDFEIRQEKTWSETAKQANERMSRLAFYGITKAIYNFVISAVNRAFSSKILEDIPSFAIKSVYNVGKSVDRFFNRLGNRHSTARGFKTAKLKMRQLAGAVRDFSFRSLLPDLRRGEARKLLPFVVALLIVMIPFGALIGYEKVKEMKGRVLGRSISAVQDLFAASRSASQMDFAGANKDFASAGEKFFDAKSEIDSLSSALGLLKVLPGKDMKLAASSVEILAAAQNVSNLGNNISVSLDNVFRGGEDIKVILSSLSSVVGSSTVEVSELSRHLRNIDPDAFDGENRDRFVTIRDQASRLSGNLTEFAAALDRISVFLGMNQDKRYLLVFQNNAEMRASGGFIGSFAIVDFKEGKIKNIEVPGGGSYDTEAGLMERVISPEPLHLLNPLWHFWDANWWPDWMKSARKLAWFYEKSDGSTVDGVISFTPDLIEDVLDAIGPVDMTADYGTVIDSGNFWDVAQAYSEQKPDVTKKPKKIIGDLANRLIEELPKRLDRTTFVKLASAFEKALREKQVLLYFYDKDQQKMIEDYGWGGRIKDWSGDYLMTVDTNIGGGKSDRKMATDISHESMIQDDGSIIDKVVIRRQLQAERGEQFIGVRNVDYLRVYVPEGSELLSADGFSRPSADLFEEPDSVWTRDKDLFAENAADTDAKSGTKIYKDSGKTVFANWSQVEPGQTSVITLEYRLPFKLTSSTLQDDGAIDKLASFFSPESNTAPLLLLVQKQPGAKPAGFTSSIVSADGQEVWKRFMTGDNQDAGQVINASLANDLYIGTIIRY